MLLLIWNIQIGELLCHVIKYNFYFEHVVEFLWEFVLKLKESIFYL